MTRTQPPPLSRRQGATTLALLLVLAVVGACSHTFVVANREAPVHIWLSAPDLAAQGGSVDALIYVGSQKVVDGPVRFPAGVPTIVLPPAYVVSGGGKAVSAVFDGGAINATGSVDVAGEAWVSIVLEGRSATIKPMDCAPPMR